MNNLMFKVFIFIMAFAMGITLLFTPFANATDATPPTDPSQLQISIVQDSKVTLEWVGSTDFIDSAGITYTIYANDTPVASTKTAPYVVTGLQPRTSYVFTVDARDSSGNASGKSNEARCITDPDYTLPTVSITYPTQNLALTNNAIFTATSTDNVGVAKVQFLIDGLPYNDPDTEAPYTTQIIYENFANNTTHTVLAESYDTSGNVKTSSPVNFAIGNPLAPLPFNINVSSITYNSAIISWQTEVGTTGLLKYGLTTAYDQQIQEVNASTHHTLNLSNLLAGKTYNYSIFTILPGYQAASSTNAAFSTLGYTDQGDTVPPQVTITYPLSGSSISGITTINVSASDTMVQTQSPTGIAEIWLEIDGVKRGSSILLPPYTLLLDTSVFANGSKQIIVNARDKQGNTASTTATYIINNTAVSAATTGAHPDGTLILDGSTVYLISNGQRAGFRDANEYKSHGYSFSQVVTASVEDKALPAQSSVIKALEGSLVLDSSDNKTVFMVGTNGTKRGFASETVFKDLGYKFEGLLKVNMSDYSPGSPITSSSEAHPDGALVLDGQTVWWIRGGTRQGFESAAVFNTYGFSFSKIVPANASDMALPEGPLVKFRDGTLVKDGSDYYIISGGKKLKFLSLQILSNKGYNIANVISANLQNYLAGSEVQ